MHALEAVTAMVAMTFGFATVFGIAYIFITARNRERMALIEKGEDASFFERKRSGRGILKWGLIALGLGVGVFMGNFVDATGMMDSDASIPAMLLICGGGALLVYYRITQQDRY